MAIAYRGGYTDGGAANPSGTINVSLSGSNAAENDVAILTIYSRGNAKDFGTVSGWTQLQLASTANGGKMYVGWRTITAADVTAGYAGSWAPVAASNVTTGITVAVFSGVEESGPIRTSATPVAGGTGNTPDPPSVTITSGDTVVAMYGKMDDDAGTHTAPSTPSSFTLGPYWSNTGGTDGCSGQAYLLAYASTSCDPGVFTTGSGGLTTYWYADTIALIPRAAATREMTSSLESVSSVAITGSKTDVTLEMTNTLESASSVTITGQKTDVTLEMAFTSGSVSAVTVTGSVDEARIDYNSYLTTLDSGSHYYVRAWATNSDGTGYGDLEEFDTASAATTHEMTLISESVSLVTITTSVTHATIEMTETLESVSLVSITTSLTQATWEMTLTKESVSLVTITGQKTDATLDAAFTAESVSLVSITTSVAHVTLEMTLTKESVSDVTIVGQKSSGPTTWEMTSTTESVSAATITTSVAHATIEMTGTVQSVSLVTITTSVAHITLEMTLTKESISATTVVGQKTDATWEMSLTKESISAVTITTSISHVVWDMTLTRESVSAVAITASNTEAIHEAAFTSESVSSVTIAGYKLARLTTIAVTSITASSGTSGGVIISTGDLPVLARGVCWNKTGNPTIADSHAEV